MDDTFFHSIALFVSQPIFTIFSVTYRWIKLPVPRKGDSQYILTPFQRYGHTAVAYNESAFIWGGRNDINGACKKLYNFAASMY